MKSRILFPYDCHAVANKEILYKSEKKDADSRLSNRGQTQAFMYQIWLNFSEYSKLKKKFELENNKFVPKNVSLINKVLLLQLRFTALSGGPGSAPTESSGYDRSRGGMGGRGMTPGRDSRSGRGSMQGRGKVVARMSQEQDREAALQAVRSVYVHVYSLF